MIHVNRDFIRYFDGRQLEYVMKNGTFISHETATIEEFRANPDEARAYLAAVLADGGPDEIQLAKRRVEAALGMPALACKPDSK